MKKSNLSSSSKRILIVGGGFGGVLTALHLSKKKIPNTTVTLVSDKHHFEYTPAFYKLATGRSPLETCIPLAEILDESVEVIVDTITGGSLPNKTLFGESGSRYRYDWLILALGSETSYFGIPGIKENAFTMKTVSEALELKRHIHELFDAHTGLSKKELMSKFQFVVVGGGPTGVELSGELREYIRGLATRHELPKKYITVNILQADSRLLPRMTEEVSRKAIRRLTKLGINVMLNKAVTSQDEHGVALKDIQMNAETIVWTAGVKASSVYANIEGLSLEKGRIVVDSYLRVPSHEHVFAIGDSASTPLAGTAQTAIYDGKYVARVIDHMMRQSRVLPAYRKVENPYVVPVGRGWAIFTYKKIVLTGKIISWLREFIDLRFFLSILPWRKALMAWREGGTLCESCPTCTVAEEKKSNK